ncbi:hypothetical protein [Thalassolituus marinus]|uniref:Bacterial virulence factor lipase N-terminal domain-containing protein n=1 Tax=Thalassolituus marinus TaxID=671053 RepID=A0ABS7ZXH0_9GAMM|nr:hypothetical protein [Thalassolituus marinus]MCA6065075.1 hypothetical protein [Thalassolituus marinus]
MVKKTLLSLAIAATTVGLAGCNISSVEKHNDNVDPTPVSSGTGTVQPATVSAIFNPARATLPLATDFLFSGSTDGTVVYAKGDVDIIVDGAVNSEYNPVYDAISDLDGFSTVGQLHIPFSGSLAEGELPAGSAYLVPLNYGEDGPKLGELVLADPFDGLPAPAAIKADVISYTDGEFENSVVRLSPTAPLAKDTRYLVILTNTIPDADGEPTVMPTQYQYLLGDDDLLNEKLAPARTAIQGWYQLAQGFMAAMSQDPSDVTLAYTFTTGGTVEVLSTMAAPGNADADLASTVPASLQNYMNTTTDDAATQVAKIAVAASVDSAKAQTIYGGHQLLKTLPAPGPRVTDFSEAVGVSMATVLTGGTTKMYTGSIELPYYSEAPSGAYEDDSIGLGADEHYACSVTTASDAAVCAAAKASAANVVLGQWETDTNVVSDLVKAKAMAAGADEATAEAAAASYIAPSENVTNLFPFAKENGKVTAPVLVVEPEAGCAKPATGWKTVIFQHGIMGNRMQSIAVADRLGKSPDCFATVAIDLPMHGLMPTDMVASGTYGGAPFTGLIPMMAVVAESAGEDDVMTFIGKSDADKLSDISAEVIKQRHFGLTADASNLPTAVTGTSADQSGSLYITFLHFQATRDNNRQAVMDLLNLNASIPFMDLDDDGNGGPANTAPDFDKDNIYFAGISLGSIVGTQFVAVNNTNTTANPNGNSALNRIQSAVFAVPGGGLPKLLENSQYFGGTLLAGLEASGEEKGTDLSRGSESFESLMYVYQATVDSADPMNFGGLMQLSQTPYTLIESVGDTVIPNSVDAAPLAGTDPLIAAFNATQVDTNSTLTAAGQVAVKLADDYSSHGSFARPDTDANTTETEATFAMLISHTISLFMGAPALDDSGAGIVEAVPAE